MRYPLQAYDPPVRFFKRENLGIKQNVRRSNPCLVEAVSGPRGKGVDIAVL
jgi:hypothetical protein